MNLVADLVTAVLLLAGACFCLLGAVGLLRFPDTVCRLHAAAKAQTLGLLLVFAGTAAQVPARYGLVLALVTVFQLVTVPVTSQIVGRTAYRTGDVRRHGLVVDELGARLAYETATAQQPDGTKGPDGTNGPDGTKGPDGTEGTDGVDDRDR